MPLTKWRNDEYITTWKQFREFRKTRKCNLLQKLEKFPNSILVAGCQRSGTTMLARIINESEELTKYWFSPDDELDAALILSGYVMHEAKGRYCFQTTYINECYKEYFKCKNLHKIIWLLRNPFSVIYSMLNNWSKEAFDGLYPTYGRNPTSRIDKWVSEVIGYIGLSRIHKACWWYKEKAAQTFELYNSLNEYSLMIVDYDDLVNNKDEVLPSIFRFLDLDYLQRYAETIKLSSIDKSKGLSNHEKNTIKDLCLDDYLRAKKLVR
jgi:hypothetical protein